MARCLSGITCIVVDIHTVRNERTHACVRACGAPITMRRYLQIFTGALASFPDDEVDAVVLEPLSAMSDAFNNGDGLHTISAVSYTHLTLPTIYSV